MKILFFFIAELMSLLYIFRNVLLIPFTGSKKWKIISGILSLFSIFFICFFENAFPSTLFIFLILLCLYPEKIHRIVCYTLFYILLINIISNLFIYTYYLFNNRTKESELIIYLSSLFAILVLFLASVLLKKIFFTNRKTGFHIHWHGYTLIAFVLLIDFFLSSVSSTLTHNNLNPLGRHCLMLAIIIMIFMSIVLLILYFRLQLFHNALKQKELLNQELLLLEEQHYKDIQKKNLDLRAFRHDYNYHVAALQALAAKDDLNKLKKYVNDLSELKEQFFYLSSNHPVTDAILNYFYENLPENTEVRLDGKFPDEIFVSDSDLCIIFSNLLKNAFEAIQILPRDMKKYIFISLLANDEYILIRMENTSQAYDTEDLNNISTSKSDRKNHGFGIENVKRTLAKYDGTLDMQYRNHTFSSTAYMRNI